MMDTISSTQQISSVALYAAAMPDAQPPSKATRPPEDTVQLSAKAQQSLGSQAASTSSQPSMSQIIREAAAGDIRALAKLVMVG